MRISSGSAAFLRRAFLVVGAAWCALTYPVLTAEEGRRPNMIVVMADDLGYGDLACFGSTKHRTPHLDRLAAEGTRFTSFYVTSGVCTPSRASLLTGCYPIRVNLHENGSGRWVLFPGDRRGLHSDEVTIAEILKKEGYKTAIIGKWHLGDQPEFLPIRHGFDSYFGIPFSNDMGKWKPMRGYPPLPLMRDDKVIEIEPKQEELTKRYTEEVIKFIESNKEAAFFLYLAHTFPHVPLYASEKFRGKSANGMYGDAVEELDWSMGQILEALKKQEIDRETLVVFLSDNGAARPHGGSNGPLRGWKGSPWEGGMRVPCIMRWPGKVPAGRVTDEIASSLDLLPTLAKLGGASAPTDRHVDGKDLWSFLAGEGPSPRTTLFYYFLGHLQAVRAGNWKLHVARSSGRRPASAAIPPELYDLVEDISEARNVAAMYPEVVRRLRALAETCRVDLGDGERPGKNTRPAGRAERPSTLTFD